ncbi:polysaccharide deacetylase family protein [Heliomicrobium modesticaldum]|nr:polysaccharide deacetylase family protein [Heliomicrobium modesticaldum]
MRKGLPGKSSRAGRGLFLGLLMLIVLAAGCGLTGSPSKPVSIEGARTAPAADKATAASPDKLPDAHSQTSAAQRPVDQGTGAGAPGPMHQAGEPIVILMYHHFTERGYWRNNDAVVYIDDFAAQMDYLRKEGYNVVPLQRIWDYSRKGTPLPYRPVAITFDDGYESNYTLAYPILKKYSFPFTLFPVAGWLLEENPPHAYDPAKGDLLDWRQIDEMVASGLCDVQSHTFDLHDKVDGRSLLVTPLVKADTGQMETPEEMRNRIKSDLQMAKETIENRYGRPVYALAFPYGQYDAQVMEIMDELGYGFGLCMGRSQHQDSMKAVIRLGVVQGDGVEGFARHLQRWSWTPPQGNRQQ